RGSAAVGGGAALRGGAEDDVGDLADGDGGALVHADHRRLDVLDAADAGGLADGDLLVVHAGEVAGGAGAVGAGRGVGDVADGQAVEGEAVLADEDLVLGELAADGDDLGDAGDRQEAVAQVELGVGAQVEVADAAVGGGESQEHHLAGDGGDGG